MFCLKSSAYHRLFPMLTSTESHISQLVDASVEDLDVKFALWLHEEKLEDITSLCSHLRCPKDYQQIAELVAGWYFFSEDLLSYTAQEVLDFYLKTDSLRRQSRFEKILIAFKELGIDVKPISEILVALKTINVSKLDKTLIVEQIAQKRLSVIGEISQPYKVNHNYRIHRHFLLEELLRCHLENHRLQNLRLNSTPLIAYPILPSWILFVVLTARRTCF